MNTNLIGLLLQSLLQSKQSMSSPAPAPADSASELLQLLLGNANQSKENPDLLGNLGTLFAGLSSPASQPAALPDISTLLNPTPAKTAATETSKTSTAAAAPEIKEPVYTQLDNGLLYCTSVLRDWVNKSTSYTQEHKTNLIKCLANIQQGHGLANSINELSEEDKGYLANTIAGGKIEPPEILNSYVSEPLKKYTDSSVRDCALKNVEVSEAKGYANSEAAAYKYGKSFTASNIIKV